MGQYLVCPPFTFAQVRHPCLILHTRRLILCHSSCSAWISWYSSAHLTSHLVPQVFNGTQIWWKCRPGNDINAICLELVHADTRRVRTCIVLLKWCHVGMSVFRYVMSVALLICELHWIWVFFFCVYIGSLTGWPSPPTPTPLTIARYVVPQFSTNENWPRDVILQITPSQITGAWNVHNHWSNRCGVIILSL